MMGDDEIIKRRLLIDGDGTSEARIMVKFIKSFIKWCSTDDSPIENHIQSDRLLAQLCNIEASSAKWSNVIKMNEEEVQEYEVDRENTKCGIGDSVTSINGKKIELEDARHIRCNRMEYDALARLIKEHPPRSDTANKLKLLNQELNSLKIKRDELEQRISLRRKQLHVLVTALHQLQMTFSDDSDSSLQPRTESELYIDLTEDAPMDVL